MSYPRWIVTLCLLISHTLSASSLDERIEMHRTGCIVIQGPPHTTVQVDMP